MKVVAKPRNLVYEMESVLQLAIIGESLPSLMQSPFQDTVNFTELQLLGLVS